MRTRGGLACWIQRLSECGISSEKPCGDRCCPVAGGRAQRLCMLLPTANADCFVRQQCTSRRSAKPRMGLEVLSSLPVQWKQWKLVVRLVMLFCSQSRKRIRKCFNCHRPVYGTNNHMCRLQRCVGACTAQGLACNDHPKRFDEGAVISTGFWSTADPRASSPECWMQRCH